MSRARFFVVFAVLLLCAGMAQANPIIDPVIIVRGGTGSVSLTSTAMVSLTYPTFPGCTTGPFPTDPYPGQLPSGFDGLQSMSCVFNNQTGVPLTSLTFTITSAQLPLTLQCAVLCSSFTQTPTGAVATFIFSTPIPYFPQGNHEFAIDFINFDPANTNFTMAVNAPEPGSLALLGTGLLAMAARLRKKRV